MPFKAKVPCRHPGCPELVEPGRLYCEKHLPLHPEVKVYEQPDSITASKKQYEKRLDITRKLLEKYEDLSIQYPKWHIKMLKIIAHCQVMLYG